MTKSRKYSHVPPVALSAKLGWKTCIPGVRGCIAPTRNCIDRNRIAAVSPGSLGEIEGERREGERGRRRARGQGRRKRDIFTADLHGHLGTSSVKEFANAKYEERTDVTRANMLSSSARGWRRGEKKARYFRSVTIYRRRSATIWLGRCNFERLRPDLAIRATFPGRSLLSSNRRRAIRLAQ